MCLRSLQVSMLMEQKLPLNSLFVFRQKANALCLGPPWFLFRSSSHSGCCGDLESDKADGSLKQLCSETVADGCRFGFMRRRIEWSLAFESSTLPPHNVVIFVATMEKTLSHGCAPEEASLSIWSLHKTCRPLPLRMICAWFLCRDRYLFLMISETQRMASVDKDRVRDHILCWWSELICSVRLYPTVSSYICFVMMAYVPRMLPTQRDWNGVIAWKCRIT